MAVSSIPPALSCVLLAEDDDAIRALMAAVLRADGHGILEVTSGIGIVAQIRTLRRHGRLPDAIVCDVRMPGMSGLRALALLRAETLGVPILVVTAHADDEIRREATRLGAYDVLDKPFGVPHLRRVVRAMVAQRATIPPGAA